MNTVLNYLISPAVVVLHVYLFILLMFCSVKIINAEKYVYDLITHLYTVQNL